MVRIDSDTRETLLSASPANIDKDTCDEFRTLKYLLIIDKYTSLITNINKSRNRYFINIDK